PWKLIHFRGKKPKTELYNLADDIGEQHDLAAERPELVADLTRQMKDLAARDNECKVHDPAAK
ncbi:MAG TPA: N-acetylgalactosamine-6-sulfatase, partial [Pirellulales bacterium]|nr:N-acetylgalactosamine-6-sulfatase [Pirellulales bacterium]